MFYNSIYYLYINVKLFLKITVDKLSKPFSIKFQNTLNSTETNTSTTV